MGDNDPARGGRTGTVPAPEPPLEPAEAVPPDGSSAAEVAQTARGALWLATNGVVVKASQTAVLLTLAALLAPSSLGLVALGTLVVNTCAVMASLGTASALVYWRGDVDRAARTAVTIGVGLGLLLAGLLWLAAPALASTLRAADGGAAVLRGLSVVLPCGALAAVTNELLRRRLAFLRRIIPDTVSSVVGAVVAITLAVHGEGVMALVVGQVVQAVLTVLLSWCVHRPVRPGWNTDDARALLAYGGPFSAANLVEVVQLNVDYLVVSAVLGGYALGQYSLAFRLAFMPYLMIVVVITGAAFPYLCRLRGERLGRATVVITTVTLTLVAPLCVGLWLFADDVRLLGDKWAPAVPVTGWLALYAVLLGATQLVQTALNAAGRPAVAMGLRLSHLGLLAVGLGLVVRHGITAVAVGQVVAAALATVVALALALRHLEGFRLADLGRSLRPALVGSAAMVAVVVGLRALLGLDGVSLGGLLLLGPAALAVYAGVVYGLDRDNLRSALALVRGDRTAGAGS